MSRRTGSVNHTHQYYRRDDGQWACSGIEQCSHYMPKNMAPMPVGKNSICWKCNKVFQLTPINMRDDKPMCDACGEEVDALDQFINKKLADAPKKDPYAKFRSGSLIQGTKPVKSGNEFEDTDE